MNDGTAPRVSLLSVEESAAAAQTAGILAMMAPLSLEVPLEEGVEPWPPDGRAPAAARR